MLVESPCVFDVSPPAAAAAMAMWEEPLSPHLQRNKQVNSSVSDSYKAEKEQNFSVFVLVCGCFSSRTRCCREKRKWLDCRRKTTNSDSSSAPPSSGTFSSKQRFVQNLGTFTFTALPPGKFVKYLLLLPKTGPGPFVVLNPIPEVSHMKTNISKTFTNVYNLSNIYNKFDSWMVTSVSCSNYYRRRRLMRSHEEQQQNEIKR